MAERVRVVAMIKRLFIPNISWREELNVEILIITRNDKIEGPGNHAKLRSRERLKSPVDGPSARSRLQNISPFSQVHLIEDSPCLTAAKSHPVRAMGGKLFSQTQFENPDSQLRLAACLFTMFANRCMRQTSTRLRVSPRESNGDKLRLTRTRAICRFLLQSLRL